MIISDLNNYKNTIDFNVALFVRNLIKKNITLNQSERTLKLSISEIINTLNDNFSDFNIEKIEYRDLFYDKSRKECGKCHKIKLHSEFSKKNRGYLKTICKGCDLERIRIKGFRTKIKIINKFFKGGCYECSLDLYKLVALDFHHIDKNLKTFIYSDIRRLNFDNIINKIKNEKLTLLCANCHSLKQAKTFNNFRDIILQDNIFSYIPDSLHKKIRDYIKEHPISKNKNSNLQSGYKTQILNWLKKRYIIEQLYDGKCVACRKIYVNPNLPAFDFHHRNANIKTYEKSRWQKISKYPIKKIIELLKKEDCICICSNCHRIIENVDFINNLNKIFKDNELCNKIKNEFIELKQNVQNFKFSDRIINDPFKLDIGFGEAWKKYLSCIYEIIQQKGKNEFNIIELEKRLNISKSGANYYFSKLVKKDLIRMVRDSTLIRKGAKIVSVPRVYELTDKGIELSTKIKLKS